MTACFLLFEVSAYAGISMELSAPKSVYLLDEPMYVTVRFRNTGKSVEQISCLLEPGIHILDIYITPPDGEKYLLPPGFEISMTSESFTNSILDLAPNSTYSGSVNTNELRQSQRTSVFDKPGKYAIECIYVPLRETGLDMTPIHSNMLNITVEKPEGDDLLTRNTLIHAPNASKFGMWWVGADWMNAYEDILQKYPASKYAVHVKFYLAQCYESYEITKLRSKDISLPLMKKAIELYSQVSQESAGSPLSAYAARLAGRVSAKIGENDKAVKYLVESFTSKDATDEDRLESLSWMNHVDTGLFQSEFSFDKVIPGGDVLMPLKESASALGFITKWDPTKKVASVFSGKIRGVLDPGKGTVKINGDQVAQAKCSEKNGDVYVSPNVIARLMAEKYGERMKNSVNSMFDKSRKY
ncbi:MAG: stalk domain-containing protein [Armatimonadota bacterium]